MVLWSSPAKNAIYFNILLAVAIFVSTALESYSAIRDQYGPTRRATSRGMNGKSADFNSNFIQLQIPFVIDQKTENRLFKFYLTRLENTAKNRRHRKPYYEALSENERLVRLPSNTLANTDLLETDVGNA